MLFCFCPQVSIACGQALKPGTEKESKVCGRVWVISQVRVRRLKTTTVNSTNLAQVGVFLE